jgi:hypothetical protein
VKIAFACGDTISGIAFCPAPQVLTAEGLNQAVAGTAFDLAGNSATASPQVSIDKTPPTILANQSPPAVRLEQYAGRRYLLVQRRTQWNSDLHPAPYAIDASFFADLLWLVDCFPQVQPAFVLDV